MAWVLASLSIGVNISGCGPATPTCPDGYTVLYNPLPLSANYTDTPVAGFSERVICQDNGCAEHVAIVNGEQTPQRARLAVTLVNTNVCRNVTIVNDGPALVPEEHGYALEGATLDRLVRGSGSVCITGKEVVLSHHRRVLQRFEVASGITVVDGNRTTVYEIRSGPTPTTIAVVVVAALLAAWLFNACLFPAY